MLIERAQVTIHEKVETLREDVDSIKGNIAASIFKVHENMGFRKLTKAQKIFSIYSIIYCIRLNETSLIQSYFFHQSDTVNNETFWTKQNLTKYNLMEIYKMLGVSSLQS